MILLDANILLYAYHAGSPRHADARAWIEHGALLVTTDRDFNRFAGLKLLDPLRGKK